MHKFVLLVLVFLSGAIGIRAAACVDATREIEPVLSEDIRAEYTKKYDEARSLTASLAGSPDAAIWLGRRTAYLGHYKEAILIFTNALAAFPADARLYRHRGHRYLTIRCFDDAIADFEKAAKLIKGKPDEIEPDGLPNARNMPTSTLQSNIWYHLGLAYYLKGDLKNALRAYRECQKVSLNNDMKVATAYWHYMTLRRLGKDKEAKRVLEPFAGSIELIENADYLKLIKMNRSELKAEELMSAITGDANALSSASMGYGIGNYYLYSGDSEKAAEIFKMVTAGNQWSSFGFIAAEAELRRSQKATSNNSKGTN